MKVNRSPLSPLLVTSETRQKDPTRAQLHGLEVRDSDFVAWLEAGGTDRRAKPRADPQGSETPPYPIGPRYL